MEKSLAKSKIIFISAYSPPTEHYYLKYGEDSYYIDSWGGLFATRLKETYPNSDIDVWNCSKEINKITEKKVHNINGVLFPYKFFVIKNIFTYQMLKKIRHISKSKNIIIHYQSVFDKFAFINYILPKNVKIVLSHHGGIPPENKKIRTYILRILYKNISAITYLTPRAKNYLGKIGVDSDRLYFLPVGADYEFYRPMDKYEARKKLHLDCKKIYAIYVGAFYRLKSVDLVLECYYKFKAKYNFDVIFIGGENNKENDLYDEVIKSGAVYKNRIYSDELILYYNAADFYIHPAFNTGFGGLDVSLLESLACNRPVLSPQLDYMDFDYSELGISINRNNIFKKLDYMITNFGKYVRCREISKNHLDGKNAIVEKLNKIYESVYL